MSFLDYLKTIFIICLNYSFHNCMELTPGRLSVYIKTWICVFIPDSNYNATYQRWYCVKSIRIRSCSGLYFPAFGNTERYSISPYSVRMQENTDQKISEYGHFLCSGFHKNIFLELTIIGLICMKFNLHSNAYKMFNYCPDCFG